mgnify:CR=1 FL=1
MQEMGPPLTHKKLCASYWWKALASLERKDRNPYYKHAVYRAGLELLKGNF